VVTLSWLVGTACLWDKEWAQRKTWRKQPHKWVDEIDNKIAFGSKIEGNFVCHEI
jgi:hypothetical protein